MDHTGQQTCHQCRIAGPMGHKPCNPALQTDKNRQHTNRRDGTLKHSINTNTRISDRGIVMIFLTFFLCFYSGNVLEFFVTKRSVKIP